MSGLFVVPASRPTRRLASGLLASILALSVAGPVGAKPPRENDRCIEAFEHSQELRREDKLLAARRELESCVAPTCPGPIVKACKTWLAEVAQALPSIVFRARRPDGEVVKNASLTIDGAPVPAGLDGQPIDLDAGEHRVTIRTAEGDDATARVTVKAKEKARETWVQLPARKVEPPMPAPPPPPLPSRRGLTAGPATLLSMSAVGLGAFIGLGASARGDANDLRSRCSPRCPSRDVDPIRTKALAADVALGVSVIALGAGLYFAWTRPAPEPTTGAGSAPRLTPFVRFARDHTGAGATLRF